MQEALEAGPSHRGPVLRIHRSSAAAGRPRRVACKRSDEPGTREDACSKGSQSEVGLERASRRRWHVHRDDGWEAMMWSGRGWGERRLRQRLHEAQQGAIVECPEGEGREVRW